MASSTKQMQLSLYGLNIQQYFMLVVNAARLLGWQLQFKDESTVVLITQKEIITLFVEDGYIIAESKNKERQLFGKANSQNNIIKLEELLQATVLQVTPEHLTEQFNNMVAERQAIAADLRKRAADNNLTGTEKIMLGLGGHYATYALMAANAIVFIAMIITGVSFYDPSTEDLLKWGGNLRAYTANGEWYRLITSTFLHGGIIHLAFNMYAFYYIGLYLEPLISRWRFLTVYLATGIFASLTSIWWTGDTVSVGASGAIFGMYGVFLALLTTNVIDKETRKPLLQSIGVFVIFNLAYGTKAGIDNAAHIGGLLSGCIFGYIYYFFFIKKKDDLSVSVAITVVITVASTFAILSIIKDDSAKLEKDFINFGTLEEKALKPLQTLTDSTPADIFTGQLENISLPAWQQAKKLLDSTINYKVNDYLKLRRDQLKRYTNLRIEQSNLFIKNQHTEIAQYQQQLDSVNNKINSLIDSLKNK